MSGKVLITGATGFLGRHLVAQLLEKSASVVAVVRGSSKVPADWGSRVELRQWDLRDSQPPAGVLDGIETVYHLASRYEGGKSADALDRLRQWNVRPTAHLIEACLNAGVRRFLYVSSIAACQPSNPYGISKLEAEQIVSAASPQKLVWTILRPTAIYGEHGLGTLAEIAQRLQKGRFALIGDGSNGMNFSYAGNVAAALIHAADSDAARGKTYIIADESVSLGELDGTLRGMLGLSGSSPRVPTWMGYGLGAVCDVLALVTRRKMPLSVERVAAATQNRVYSGAELRQETGFNPPFERREALERTLRWYRAQGAVS